MELGDFNGALVPLRQAWVESRQQHDITLAYTHALVESLRLDEAATVLDGVRMADRDAGYEQLRAQLQIKREAAKSPEIEALEHRLSASPEDLDVRYQLGVQYTNNKQFREAMEHFIAILRKDLGHGNGATKRMLLDTIASLGKGDPLAVEYQRKLYSLLY
jgi:putative thioredoxin